MLESIQRILKETYESWTDDIRRGEFRLTIQRKFSIIFTAIVMTIMIYVTSTMYADEKEALIRLSNEQFQSIFTSVTTIGDEALSVGKEDQIMMKTVLTDLFKREIQGLEKIFFASRKKEFYVYADKQQRKLTGTTVSDSLWTFLETYANQEHRVGNRVYFTRKIDYRTANRTVFLGYGQMVYTLDHINEMIAEKRARTIWLGVFAFFISLMIIAVVTHFLTKRIKELKVATEALSEGNYQQLPVRGKDEIADLTSSFNEMSKAVRERLLMAKYVSGSTIEQISGTDASELDLGGNRETVTVFFSDIRGFTAFSEKNDAEVVVHHLNFLLDMQVEVINRFGGDIDKFVGDEIFAVFRGDEMEKRSVQAGIEIQKRMRQLAADDPVYDQLKVGIGINTGEVVSGNIGSRNRMDFTLIGDTVNTGARLCGAAKGHEIIISQYSKPPVEKLFSLSEPFFLDLKNKSEKLSLFYVEYNAD